MENVFLSEKDLLLALAGVCRGWSCCDGVCLHRCLCHQHCFATTSDHTLVNYERSSQVLSLDIVAVFLNVSSPTPRFTHRRAEGAFFPPGDSQWAWRRITGVVQLQYVHVLHIISSAIANLYHLPAGLSTMKKLHWNSFFHNSIWYNSRYKIHLLNRTNLMGHDLFAKEH